MITDSEHPKNEETVEWLFCYQVWHTPTGKMYGIGDRLYKVYHADKVDKDFLDMIRLDIIEHWSAKDPEFKKQEMDFSIIFTSVNKFC